MQSPVELAPPLPRDTFKVAELQKEYSVERQKKSILKEKEIQTLEAEAKYHDTINAYGLVQD